MRRPCALLLVVLGLASGAPLRAEPPAAREVIRDCARRAKPDLVGMDALRTDCPQLATAIEDLGLTAHLPQGWKKRVDTEVLEDWSALADRYDRSGAPVPLPDSARLQTIAGSLRPPPELPNWWERFKTWMGSWLDPERGQWPDWLRWPERWRPGNTVLYGVMVLVLIAALVVIAMERHQSARQQLQRPTLRSGKSPKKATRLLTSSVQRACCGCWSRP
jgi:hypothetical protein